MGQLKLVKVHFKIHVKVLYRVQKVKTQSTRACLSIRTDRNAVLPRDLCSGLTLLDRAVAYD